MDPRIAYFSMEIALDPALPTYAGGLGVLAGDTLLSAADLGLPMVGVTLLYRHGYFRQQLDAQGMQSEHAEEWRPEELLEPLQTAVDVEIEGRPVHVRAWRKLIQGIGGRAVPVYFLDTDVEPNTPADRTLADSLYLGDDRYRFCQEVLLGIGGVRLLAALGHREIETFHMNEGHAALLSIALVEQRLKGRPLSEATAADLDALRRQCVFTTHTPVAAGHDQFPRELAERVLGQERVVALDRAGRFQNGVLNMTNLALEASHYVNGVGMRHGEISRGMFPRYPIRAITNGVHAVRWTSPAFAALFDRHIPEWRRDNLYLRYAIGIEPREIAAAHAEAKRAMIDKIRECCGADLDPSVLTIGFARRATGYKRPELLLTDLERLRSIATRLGPFQVIYSGKAHPRDSSGIEAIQRIFAASALLRGRVPIVYLENYDLQFARFLTAGVDLWLNTPQRPQEASGTSGMKAALNGVPSLSILDGWWLEGHVEGVTGWAIASHDGPAQGPAAEAASLYEKLEGAILPTFYGRPEAYVEMMRSTIALNGSFFNSQRMLRQYAQNAYGIEC
ncbi:MAG TPA: alpha-glucan family phosphorylase [Candidatus Dormibacteraeota bacterium]|nr:alpha-glucan family phosphorylase [Candidatus Dormibacteraeota bacterium]